MSVMMRDFLIVGAGSFVGGGMRYLVSCAMNALCGTAFPFATFLVNVVGCLVIGFLYGLGGGVSPLSQSARLLLATGFCGGFTTFSTFINESSSLFGDSPVLSVVYVAASVAVGLLALALGNALAKCI